MKAPSQSDFGITIRANVRLLATADGGRSMALKGGTSYRPNHNFFGPDNRNMTVGFIELPESKDVFPGESVEVIITLWAWLGLEGQVFPGREWRIQEGPRVVGIGTVLEVLPNQ